MKRHSEYKPTLITNLWMDSLTCAHALIRTCIQIVVFGVYN